MFQHRPVPRSAVLLRDKDRMLVGTVDIVPPQRFADSVADRIADAIVAAGGPSVSLALSGGNTVRRIYSSLARDPRIDWGRVAIYQTDERCVPPGHPRNNYDMIAETLLAALPRAPQATHRMLCGSENEPAARYEAVLPDRLDVTVLGIGEDGHILSVFPGQPTIWRDTALVSAAQSTDGERRLTLTPDYALRTGTGLVLASGGAKASAVRRALWGPQDPVGCPASMVRGWRWILDESAAAELPPGFARRAGSG